MNAIKNVIRTIKIKNKLIIYCFVVISLIRCNPAFTQEFKVQDIEGNWKVNNFISTLHSQETEYEKKLDLEDRKFCLKALVTIDTNSFKIKNVCGYEDCISNFIKNPPYKKIPLVKDDSNKRQSPGQEIVENNQVGETFIHLLDENYSINGLLKDSLIIIDTYCKESFGDFTVKVCIINNNKIGLFSGADLIILERIKTKQH